MNAIERRLVGLFAAIIGSPGIDAETDFFAAGGDSLKALRLSAQSEAEVGASVTTDMLLKFRTARALAEHLSLAAKLDPGAAASPSGSEYDTGII